MTNDRYDDLLEAIEHERKNEQDFYQKLNVSKTIQQRIDGGYLWYPVELQNRRYSIGDQIELTFEKKKDADKPHKLKTGIGVRVFKEGEDAFSYMGVISFVRRDKIKIFVGDEHIMGDHRLTKGLIGIEAIYDEKPFQIMKKALLAVKDRNDVRFMNFKNGILTGDFGKSYQDPIPKEFVSSRLNPSQSDAVHTVSSAEYVGIVYGPPGTGKTTTLVQLIKQLVKKEKRVLVCAPSNNAVDLLATLLHQIGLNVLRVGNVSRVDDDTVHLTLSEKARNHPEWKQIKKVRILEQEAFNQAGQFKRKFGQQEREDRKAMYKEAKELRKWARDLEDRLKDQIVDEAQVICTTLIGASHSSIDNLEYQTVIIDEASQALEPSCWNVILKAQRVILAGDHKQLSPVVKSEEAKKLGLGVTLLDRLMDKVSHTSMLKVQYRMHQSILGFSNQMFYEDALESHESVVNHTLPNDTSPAVFIDTSGCGFEEVFNEKNRSYANPEEYYILREYMLQQKEKQVGFSIGIIAPYGHQVQVMREFVSQDEEWRDMDVEVNTVDGFQGQEKDIIYISLVRSNDQGNIGFLSDERRLNVAMTRAKKKLVLIGDMATLSYHELFRKLADYMEKEGEYKSAWEFMV